MAHAASTRKILVSPGFGGSWSADVSNPDLKRDFVFDPALIAAVEAAYEKVRNLPPDAGRQGFRSIWQELVGPAIEDFGRRMIEKYPDESIYIGPGADDLIVTTVDGPFLIEEYDGSEYVLLRDKIDWL